MVDYLLGLLLFALGIKKGLPPANVLGESTATLSATVTPIEEDNDDDTDEAEQESEDGQKSGDAKEIRSNGLKVMRPKFTVTQQEAFQKERKKREDNLKKVSEAKLKELGRTFEERHREKIASDDAQRRVLAEKVKEFKDAKKRQKLIELSAKFQSTVTNRITGMQHKLESMSSLLDRILAAAGALKAQGVDVSAVEADVTLTQTKISNAMNQMSQLASSLPTAFSVSSETSAKVDVESAIKAVKAQLEPAKQAFEEAREALGKTLSDLEKITDAEEVGTWPVKP